MRLPLLLLAVLAACGPSAKGQPKLFRIALDRTAERTIATASCFKGGSVPMGGPQITESNFREEHQWVIWDGVEGKQYLDMGAAEFTLGDAPKVVVGDLIEGSDKTFAASRTVLTTAGTAYSEARQTTIKVSFNEAGSGTIEVKGEYSCFKGNQECPERMSPPQVNPAPDSVTCSATLGFVSRELVVQQTSNYAPKGD